MTKKEKSRRIIQRNNYFIKKYESLKNMALARGDKAFAKNCDKQIAMYKGGVLRWSN